MALKDTWNDKQNDVDIVDANDINDIANAVIDLENDEIIVQTTGDSTTDVMSQKATTEEINALKGDLADKLPKSPSSWEPWTSEEQAAARDRMGVSNSYYVLMDEVLTKKSNEVLFTIPDDTAEFLAYFEVYNITPESVASAYLRFTNENGKYPWHQAYSTFGDEIKLTDNNIRALQKCIVLNDTDILVEYSALSKDALATSERCTRGGRVSIAKRTSNTVYFHLTAASFPIGTRFIVIARRK